MLDGFPQRLIAAGIALAAVLAFVPGCGGENSSTPAPQGAGSGEGERRIVALGRLEPAGGVIAISAIPGERLTRLADGVVEGQVVPAGAELGRLDSYVLRDKQLAAVQAKLTLAEKQQAHEIAAATAQVKQAEATLAQAEAKRDEAFSQSKRLSNLEEAAAIAREDFERIAELRKDDPELVTEHQLRRQQNASDRAIKEYEAAYASYEPAKVAAIKAVEAATEGLKLAEKNLDFARETNQIEAVAMEKGVAEEVREQSILHAPGEPGDLGQFTVLKIYTRPGEFVTQMPILDLGDVREMACIAEVYEADAKNLAPGQPVTIRSSAFKPPLADGPPDAAGQPTGGIPGRVVSIGKVISKPGLTNRNPLAPSDRSVIEVRIEVDPDGKTPGALDQVRDLIGLQVTVTFEKPDAAARSGASASETPAAETAAAPAEGS